MLLGHPGSALKPVSLPRLFEGILQTFDLAMRDRLYLPTNAFSLFTVTGNWGTVGKSQASFRAEVIRMEMRA